MAAAARTCLMVAACVLLLAITTTGAAAAAANPGLGRRSLLQNNQWANGNRPAWFNNNRVQSGNWGNNNNNGANAAGNSWAGGNGNGNNWGGNGARPNQWQQQLPAAGSNGQAQAGSSAGGAAPGRLMNPNRNKGDISTLSALTSPVQSFRNRPRQSIAPPTTGPASTLYQGFRRGGSAKANADSIAETFNSNSEAAATAVASAATEGGASSAVAEAMAATTVSHPGVAPGLFSKTADLAVAKGQTAAFAGTMADAFSVAKRGSYVPQFTRSVTQAVAQGGPSTKLAYGEAIATAIAQGGDSKAAVAEATATAFCEGGSTAQSWASAYAIALSKDSQGCLVLNEAKAMATAKCGAGAAEAFSKAEATSLVLGFCGLLDVFPGFDYNFSSGNSGSSTWSP